MATFSQSISGSLRRWPPEEPNRGPSIVTSVGQRFYPFTCRPEEISIFDIAAGLSKEQRFVGQMDFFYPVSTHSILVSRMLPKHLQFEGLMHDWPEAYLKDIPRPWKHSIMGESYRRIEDELWKIGAEKWGFNDEVSDLVKLADDWAHYFEERELRRYTVDTPAFNCALDVTAKVDLPATHFAARSDFLFEYRKLEEEWQKRHLSPLVVQ